MLNFSVNKIGSSLLITRNVTSKFRARASTTSFSSLLSARLPTTSVVRMKSTEQNDLLRLPVPNVAETAQKYLATVTPLLNREEFYETTKVVEQFQDESKPLQQLLIKRAQIEQNWLSKWWLDKTYLEWRLNLPIFYNPALLFPRAKYRDFDGQLQFAANFLHGALKYQHLIDNDLLPIDRSGNEPLCMDQYKKLFRTIRIPAEKIDRIMLYEKDKYHHIAVFYRNQLYRLPVYDDNGNQFSAQQIYSQLKRLEQINDQSNSTIGHLTADERQNWAPIYARLSAIAENKTFFQTINDSLLVLCLDEKPANADQNQVGLNFLHGGGTQQNTANRWFDKTLQLIVGPDGFSGFNYEHSVAEGGMITALVDFALDYCKTASKLEYIADPSVLTKCEISVPKEIESLIAESQNRVDKFITNCDLHIHSYRNFGKKFTKENKLSIDGVIQVALQVAYYRLHGKCGATYESGSLRRYHLGRTETIRSCTSEALEFSRAMAENIEKTSSENKFQLFSRAMNAQRKYTTDATNAKGIDRHLLGLKLIALENHLPKPKLYDHFSYKRAMHFTLSTSQVGAKHDCVMIYGPAVDDGYGCCYNPRNDGINYMVSAFKVNSQGTDVKKFSEQFSRSLDDIRNLIEQNTGPKLQSKL